MKKAILLLLPLFCIALLSATFSSEQAEAKPIKFPKKVDAVIQAKCFGCHSNAGKSDKAKGKLNWEELSNMDQAMQLEKMNLISGVLEEGSMPPSRMVERKPEMKLSDTETATLKKWSAKYIKKLSK